MDTVRNCKRYESAKCTRKHTNYYVICSDSSSSSYLALGGGVHPLKLHNIGVESILIESHGVVIQETLSATWFN